ncbi:Two-component system protein A [Fusarium oxysporum]|nr:Two-component system protein A [Fusarium oxysporum]
MDIVTKALNANAPAISEIFDFLPVLTLVGSLTERFDYIPFVYAIETALMARALCLCYAAYTINAVKDYAIFLLDTCGNVISWNTRAELSKGYKKEEIISKKPERELKICLHKGRANIIITAIYKNDIYVGFEAELQLITTYKESIKLKNDFLANISYKIYILIYGMLSAYSLLLDSCLTEEQQEIANIINESGYILLRIINDILDYFKIIAGSFPIENDKVDIAMSLRLSLLPNLLKWVEGDPLSNAAKFTKQGYILVSISLLTEDMATYIILTKLNTLYYKRRQGTRLRLSIAKLIAELLGGNIRYKPNPERQGSIFYLQQIQTVDALPISPIVRILAAEDNIIDQKILVEMLHGFGFWYIIVVSDGAQAVLILSAIANAFDLILMDISMPVINSYNATVQIRNSGIHLPIIAMTAYALKGDMERYLEKGMDDYIAKPMNK